MNNFENIYEIYADKVYKFIYYKVGNKEDAQDITSETFLKVYNNLTKYDENKASAQTWIYNIAYHTCIDWLKSQKNYAPYEWIKDQAYEEDLLQILHDKDRLQSVMNFLDGIDSIHKQIFMMRIWENIPYNEIAKIIEISPSASKQIFYRTMQKITERFGIMIILSLIYGIQ